MPKYANGDAEHVAHGIRLGGKGALLDAVGPGQQLTVSDLEQLARPDLYEPDPAEDQESWRQPGPEGMVRIYCYTQHGDYDVACDWFGWVPGHYATREAGLTAYGYLLGGEQAGELEEMVKEQRPHTVTDIERFAASTSQS